MLTIPHILAAVALLAGYCVFLLVRPHRVCSWCKGTRRAKKHRTWGRVGKCPKCKGRKEHQRLGAALVHRFFWAVAGDRVKAAISRKGSQ